VLAKISRAHLSFETFGGSPSRRKNNRSVRSGGFPILLAILYLIYWLRKPPLCKRKIRSGGSTNFAA